MMRIEVVKKCNEILLSHCDDPSDELIKIGKAIVAIGQALKGMSISDARETMEAVKHLNLITETATKKKTKPNAK